MISVIQAKKLIDEASRSYKKRVELADLFNCNERILARDLVAKYSSPPFNQSAMDGYAVNYDKGLNSSDFKLISQEIKAGDSKLPKLKSGEAVRIYTGAPVPDTATVVIPQEFVVLDENNTAIKFDANRFKKSDNIRFKGEQFAKGTVVLHKGEKLNSAKIALVATAGIGSVPVYTKPTITIISSGNELCVPGSKLKAGQVYDSNSYMLASLLSSMGIEVKNILYLKDDLKKTIVAIEKSMNTSDVLLVSGGISVGKYDLIKASLDKLNTKTIFYKVNQKPGKPLYFGKNKSTFVFGLPGNPAASFTCFHEYVKPLLNKISGENFVDANICEKKLLNSYVKKKGMTFFMKGFIDSDGVTILSDQESFKINSFANANCIVVGQEQDEKLEAGMLLECHLL